MSTSMLKAKVNAALEKIGTTNGTAAADSQDPADKVAHEYNVAAQMASYAEKRKEIAKKALINALSNASAAKLETIKGKVKKNEISETVTIIDAEHHTVAAQVKIGATFLDNASLAVELKKKMSTEEVDALIARHTKRREPSVTYVVSENDEG